MRDQTGYYRTTPRPTPPSDAGTSERETRDHRTATGETCPKCGNAKLVFRLQGSQPRFDNLRSCRCCGEMFALPAAAPAAEGPRHERCPNDTNGDGDCGLKYCPFCSYRTPDAAEGPLHSAIWDETGSSAWAETQAAEARAAEGPRALYVQIRAITDDDLDSAARKMVDTLSQERRPDGAAGLLAEVRGRWWKLVSPYRAPAALPGAEAGTPTLVDGYDATFWRDSYRMLANAVDLHLGDYIQGDDVAEEAIYEDAIVQAGRRLAALTSEVRARNEKLAEALVRAEKAEAELGVLRKHLGRVSPTKLLKSNIDRFWKNVEKTETCWLWIGTLDKGGYGRQFVGSRSIKAHRYSWELHVAPIPAGLHVLHNCPGGDNRRCVNPAHLWLGTLADNNADMVLKGRGGSRTAWPKGATECRNGHPLTAESIVILPDGARRCRICRLARQRQYTKRRAIRDAIDAARLASPSPTGAPSSPANPQEDETDAR